MKEGLGLKTPPKPEQNRKPAASRALPGRGKTAISAATYGSHTIAYREWAPSGPALFYYLSEPRGVRRRARLGQISRTPFEARPQPNAS